MTTITPAGLVAAPARTPLPYGLFSVLPFRPNGDDRWEGGGVEWEALPCDLLGGIGAWQCEVNAIFTLTFGGTGLVTYRLVVNGVQSTAIAAAANAATVQAALEAVVDTGNATVTGTPGAGFTITFVNEMGNQPVTLNALPTGGSGTTAIAAVQVGGEATTGLPKSLDANGNEIGSATQFTVYGHFRCTPVGWSPEQAQARALDHLMAREEAAVENALWTGALGNLPSLEGAGTTILGAADEPMTVGLGLLEDFIASTYGSLGVIHMTRGAAMSAAYAQALVQSMGRLTTVLGTPVVVGAGYPGTSPLGAVPTLGESWIYASPALMGYRSEVFTSSNRSGDLLDRGTNDLYAIAERSYLVGFDPCGVGAVQVKHTP